MKKILSIICLFLLYNTSFSQGDQLSFKEVEQLVDESPEEILEKALTDKFSYLTDREEDYIKIQAYLNLSMYEKSDSIIQAALANGDFPKDSLLYMNYLLTWSAQQKVEQENEKSIDNLFQVIEIARRQKDTVMLVTSKTSLGEFYRAMQSYKQGLRSLEEAEKIIEKYRGEKTKLTIRLYDRRASIFLEDLLYPDSVEWLSLKCIQLSKEIKDVNLIASSSNVLGHFYARKTPPDLRAEIYLKDAISIWDSIEHTIYATNARINLATYFIAIEEFKKAERVVLSLKEGTNEVSWKYHEAWVNKVLGDIYEEMGEYEKAVSYLRRYDTLKEQKIRANYIDKLSLHTIEFEVKEKKEELLRQELAIELQEAEINAAAAEKRILYVFLIAALIVVLSIIYFMTSLRKKNQLLSTQKETISKSNEQLSELLDQREALLKEVNHRVKNNLTVLSSLLYLQDENLEGKEAKDAIKISLSRVHSIALIHDSLYQQVEVGNRQYQDYVVTLFERIKSIYWTKNVFLRSEIDVKEFEPDLEDSVPIGMILNELITNSFKYAFERVEEPLISIHFENNSLIYYDNGPGYVPKSSSGSLGLKLISTFAMQLEAEIEYKQVDKYTHTIIRLG